MGKDVSFKCIDVNFPHSDNRICMEWDYEPEKDDKYLQIIDKLNPEFQNCMDRFFKTTIDYNLVWDAFKDQKICDRCTWFFQSGNKTPMLLGSCNIHHAYSNPVLSSDWFIDSFMYCEKAREYDQSYGGCYRVDLDDVKEIRERVDFLGKPIRVSDREAREETIEALDWVESIFEQHKDKKIEVLYFGEL